MYDERSPLLKDAESQKSRSLGISRLLAGLVGVFLAGADKSVLLTTQNQIASSLQSPYSAPLLLVSYNLGFCVALPVYGFLSDIYGSRNFLLLSYALFSVGCAISGAVDSLWPFAFGRLLAGIGGSGMTDLLSVLINGREFLFNERHQADHALETFDVKEIASVRSWVIAAEIFGQGCGGPLGGIITDKIGWRWALLGQVPIGFLCLILAHWQLPQTPKKTDVKSKVTLWSFDYLGLAAFVTSTTAFVLATTDGSPTLDANKPALFCTWGIFLILLIVVEKFSPRPIFPASLVTAPGLRNVFLGQFAFFANVSIVMNTLPSYLSQIEQMTSSQIALRIWPSCLGLVLGAMIAGRALRTTVQYRRISLIGTVITVASLLVMVVRWMDGIQGVEVFYGFPWALGCGMLLSAQFLALTNWSPEDQMANATAIYCLAQQIGQIVGTSGSTAALQQLFRLRLGANLTGTPNSTKIIQKILQNYWYIEELPHALRRVVQFSYIEAFRLVPALSTTMAVITGIIVSFT
ncbi:unnamed protein product [Penicillium olsonii]|nr:unnamed protein product [Penicillium olsonii]CAG7934461.1 unnamed protein product [Penicillium olsonii]